jgi:hypothetical protein
MSIYDNTFTKDGVKLPYMTGVEYDKRKKDAVDGVTDVTAPTLAAAGQADLVKANAINREVAAEETSAFQLDKILGSDSALMKRAESQGLQRGASRGLLNSSIAVEAAQGAMIDRAQPFALNDASTYFNTAESNMRANNQAELTNAQMGTELNIFNTGQNNTFATTQAGLDSQANLANAASANSALFSFLDRENSGFLQQNQQTFTAAENLADRTLRETLQKDSITAAAEENALNRASNVSLQDDAQAFSTSENAATRIANAAENALNRATNTANTNTTIAANVSIATQNTLATVLADPDLTAKQKENLATSVLNTSLETVTLVKKISEGLDNSTNTTDNADTTASAAEKALSGVSAAGGFSQSEANQVYDAIKAGTATVNEVSQILGVSPGDVSAGYEQITNDRAAAAATTAAATNNASSNTGLLNSFEDYDLYDRRYNGGEGQRV